MSRVWAVLVAGLGAFLLAGAVALPTIGEPKLFKIPLDQPSTTVAEASGATVIDTKTLTEQTGVDLVAARTVIPQVNDSTRDRVVFDVFLSVEDPNRPGTPKQKVVNATLDKLAMDRRTSEAVPYDAESYDGKSVAHKGLTYKFPFHTEKKTYTYWDNTAAAAYPIRFVGTDTIKGLEAYKFTMTVDPVQISLQDFDGSLLGDAKGPVKAPRYYENLRTIWVEPTSGLIVRGREEQKQTLHNAAGEPKFTIIEADLDWTDKTITQQSDRAKDALTKYRVIVYVAPAILGVLGALLLLLGVMLVRNAQKRGPAVRRQDTGQFPANIS